MDIVSDLIQYEKRDATWNELASRTFVGKGTLKKYMKKGAESFPRLDTLRGLLLVAEWVLLDPIPKEQHRAAKSRR